MRTATIGGAEPRLSSSFEVRDPSGDVVASVPFETTHDRDGAAAMLREWAALEAEAAPRGYSVSPSLSPATPATRRRP